MMALGGVLRVFYTIFTCLLIQCASGLLGGEDVNQRNVSEPLRVGYPNVSWGNNCTSLACLLQDVCISVLCQSH